MFEVYAKAMQMGLLSLTEARVMAGTASLKERLGYSWPTLFRKWAAKNAEADARYIRQQKELADLETRLRGYTTRRWREQS